MSPEFRAIAGVGAGGVVAFLASSPWAGKPVTACGAAWMPCVMR